ncbi:hypothetical protein D3C75_542920 [compost metagenome]
MYAMPAHGIQHTLGQLLATVHRDLPGTVTQRRIAVTLDQQIRIATQIDASDFQRRCLLVQHQGMRGATVVGVFHAVINVLIARQVAQIRQE